MTLLLMRVLIHPRSSASSGCLPFGFNAIASSCLVASLPAIAGSDSSPKLSLLPPTTYISLGLSRPLASSPLVGVFAFEIDTPTQRSLSNPTSTPTSESMAQMVDSHPLEWVHQRMLEVGRKLGPVTNGEESLLSYLVTVRDLL